MVGDEVGRALVGGAFVAVEKEEDSGTLEVVAVTVTVAGTAALNPPWVAGATVPVPLSSLPSNKLVRSTSSRTAPMAVQIFCRANHPL